MLKLPVTILLLCLAGTLPTAALLTAPYFRDAYEKPDHAKMRAYRISRFDDNRLIELKEQSGREFQQHKEAMAEDGRKYWRERQERAAACEANPAAKLRDPDHCYEPLPFSFEDIGKPAMGWESPEQFFEDHIMGVCELADSVRDAKRRGCLPP